MLTVGGSNTSAIATSCDWHTKGVGVLDMSKVVWGSDYNATADPYTVPTQIVDIIGGT